MRAIAAQALSRTVAALALCLCATTAHAHGGFWRAHDILIAPDDGMHIAARSDVWGLLRSDDGGERWRWICAEPFGRETTTPRRIAMAALPGGALAVASLGDGLRLLDDDPCQWREATELADTLVRGVAYDAGDGGRLLALATRSEGAETRTLLFASDDAGESFPSEPTMLPAGFVGTSLAIAPGDPMRVYAVAGAGETLQVARSEDGGQGFTVRTHTIAMAAAQWEARLLAIRPAAPDVLIIVADAFEPRGGQLSPDSVFVSSDGGETVSQLFTGQSDVPAAAFSPDGSELVLGGIRDGLLGAATEAVLADGGAALEPRHAGGIYGLRWSEAGLFSGTEEFMDGGTGYSIGRSDDGGRSFTRLMGLCDVEPESCGDDTTGGVLCPMLWSDMGVGSGGFTEDFQPASRCETDSPDAGLGDPAGDGDGGAGGSDSEVDGGAPGPPDGDDAGCSCRTVGGSGADGIRLRNSLLAAPALALLWARRRRRAGLVTHSAKNPHTC